MTTNRPATNHRLLRIAESICSCVLTDGFCGPKHKPDCRCWAAARAAVEGLASQADPVLAYAWPYIYAAERRKHLDHLVAAIRELRDEMTTEHEHRRECAHSIGGSK